MSIYYDAQDYQSVETSLRRAVEINPSDAEAHLNLGIVLYKPMLTTS
jgi:Flp pilus assembly protein TadD